MEIQVQTHHFPSKHVTDTKTKPYFKIISSASAVNYLLFNFAGRANTLHLGEKGNEKCLQVEAHHLLTEVSSAFLT